MSFLLDPGLLVASGVAIERLVPEKHRSTVEATTIATFIGVTGALYANAPCLGVFWKPFRSRGGRDFVLNSGVFHFDSDAPGPGSHLVAGAILSTYPLWLRLGRRLGRRAGPVPDRAALR